MWWSDLRVLSVIALLICCGVLAACNAMDQMDEATAYAAPESACGASCLPLPVGEAPEQGLVTIRDDHGGRVIDYAL